MSYDPLPDGDPRGVALAQVVLCIATVGAVLAWVVLVLVVVS